MSKAGVYRFSHYQPRGYDVEGTFVATDEQVAAVIGKTVHFGEICGKHSDVSVVPTEKTLTLLTDDPAVVDAFVKFGFSSGHDPVAQFEDLEEEEEEEEEEE